MSGLGPICQLGSLLTCWNAGGGDHQAVRAAGNDASRCWCWWSTLPVQLGLDRCGVAAAKVSSLSVPGMGGKGPRGPPGGGGGGGGGLQGAGVHFHCTAAATVFNMVPIARNPMCRTQMAACRQSRHLEKFRVPYADSSVHMKVGRQDACLAGTARCTAGRHGELGPSLGPQVKATRPAMRVCSARTGAPATPCPPPGSPPPANIVLYVPYFRRWPLSSSPLRLYSMSGSFCL